MGIVNDQTLHAILHEQLKEEVFAFTPASPRGEAQSGQEKVAQRRFTRIVFGSGHCQHGISPPTNRPRQALCLIPQIARLRCFFASSTSSCMCTQTEAEAARAAFAFSRSCCRMAAASHALTRCPIKAWQ